MKFDELDGRMRHFEAALSPRLPDDTWVVARLDGRKFSRLTRDRVEFQFAKPFDERFRDLMLQAAREVLIGFNALFAHTHSDEMSLLLPRARAFDGKARKYLSLMASTASVAFSMALKHPVTFDCRLISLPREENVVDYFRWRMADSERNALSAHFYWLLRAQGQDARDATRALDLLSPEEKALFLEVKGVRWPEVPLWHKRGAALFWRSEEIKGRDPRSGAEAPAMRRRLRAELNLPEREEYAALIQKILQQAAAPTPEPRPTP